MSRNIFIDEKYLPGPGHYYVKEFDKNYSNFYKVNLFMKESFNGIDKNPELSL